jgi:hypothetical protein
MVDNRHTLTCKGITSGSTSVGTADSVLLARLTHELVGNRVRAVPGDTSRGVVTTETGVETRLTRLVVLTARLRVGSVGVRVLMISNRAWGG